MNLLKKIAILSLIIVILAGVQPKETKAYSELMELSMAPIALNLAIAVSDEGPTNENKPSLNSRAKRLDEYFAKRDMPLASYGAKFVKVADFYGLDWRLLPAVGVRESSGGKHLMNRNPFGWGSAKIPFKNFNEAIEVVAKNLAGASPSTARYYKDKTTFQKLWAYNGTVMPTYPDEVIAIMNMF